MTKTALDKMTSLDLATLMNREDAKVARAVKKVLPQIARAIDVIAERLSSGGRLIYVGSGSSGRIGALDASECPPTFNTEPSMVQSIIAGGPKALTIALESQEDSPDFGRRDIANKKPGKEDVVVGISASGNTPYTLAALEYAGKKNAVTVAVVCTKGSPLAETVDIPIEVNTGAEVLAGSTRLKAGSAQKMICNMLTTGAMARLGFVYGDLMVNVQTNNAKLFERAVTILMQAANVERDSAIATLELADMKLPVALLILKAGTNKGHATRSLKSAKGNIRQALNFATQRRSGKS